MDLMSLDSIFKLFDFCLLVLIELYVVEDLPDMLLSLTSFDVMLCPN
jgi:hypothetical protein